MSIVDKIDQYLTEGDLNESSLSRIWQFVEDKNRQFGVMSAFRGDISPKENKQRHEELKKRVRDMGYGYIEMDGGYEEEQGIVKEKSLFIPKISRKELMELGVEYDQHTVIFKDGKGFSLIGTNVNSGIGNVVANFKHSAGRDNLIKGMKELFSALVKGSHRGKKFLFFMED